MSRWIRIGRKRVLDERPDWRDPNMPVLRSWKEESGRFSGMFYDRSEMVSPEFSQELSQDSLSIAEDRHRPNWRKDPTYFLRPDEQPVIPPPPEVAPEDEAAVGRCSSPWGGRELAAIKKWQKDPLTHSLTCPNHSDQPLHVDELELYCPSCDYTQDWVPDGVAGVNR